jgi:hypothetical protein
MDIIEIQWGGIDWINLAQGRQEWSALGNTEMKLRFQLSVGKLLELVSYWRLVKNVSAPRACIQIPLTDYSLVKCSISNISRRTLQMFGTHQDSNFRFL